MSRITEIEHGLSPIELQAAERAINLLDGMGFGLNLRLPNGQRIKNPPKTSVKRSFSYRDAYDQFLQDMKIGEVRVIDMPEDKVINDFQPGISGVARRVLGQGNYTTKRIQYEDDSWAVQVMREA